MRQARRCQSIRSTTCLYLMIFWYSYNTHLRLTSNCMSLQLVTKRLKDDKYKLKYQYKLAVLSVKDGTCFAFLS